MKKLISPVWLPDVADSNYAAALAYLSLKLNTAQAEQIVSELRSTPVTERRANDLLRACEYAPLPLSDPGVRHEYSKLSKGRSLSPILVVSFAMGADIADGYHRLSYSYAVSPYELVPLRLVEFRE